MALNSTSSFRVSVMEFDITLTIGRFSHFITESCYIYRAGQAPLQVERGQRHAPPGGVSSANLGFQAANGQWGLCAWLRREVTLNGQQAVTFYVYRGDVTDPGNFTVDDVYLRMPSGKWETRVDGLPCPVHGALSQYYPVVISVADLRDPVKKLVV